MLTRKHQSQPKPQLRNRNNTETIMPRKYHKTMLPRNKDIPTETNKEGNFPKSDQTLYKTAIPTTPGNHHLPISLQRKSPGKSLVTEDNRNSVKRSHDSRNLHMEEKIPRCPGEKIFLLLPLFFKKVKFLKKRGPGEGKMI